MNRATLFVGPGAVGLMIFYYFLPVAIIAGAPDSILRLWPWLMASSALLIGVGLFQFWRAKRAHRPLSKLSARVFWCSAIAVLMMMLFPQPIANLVAKLADLK
jgi:hypothetical protein